MTPYLIWIKIGLAVLFLGSFGGYMHHSGYQSGTNDKAAVDQVQFDATNKAIAAQKALANSELLASRSNVLAERQTADEYRAKLENEREAHRADTEKSRMDLAAAFARGMRLPAQQDSGRGDGGANSVPQATAAASNADPAYCVISGEVQAAISSILYDADTLRVDYKLLYDNAHPNP